MQASRKYAKSKSKALKIKEFSLVEKLNTLDTLIVSGNVSECQLTDYENVKHELEQIEGIKARGAWIRSRVECIELNEKNFL